MKQEDKTEPITMRKKGSPHLVRIAPDPEDAHFSRVQLVKLSTGEVKGSHYILTSDVPQWMGMYERDGFHRVEIREEVAQ